METLRTLVNVGKNVEYQSKYPVITVTEKKKEFEVREYQKAQFVFIRIKNKIEIDTDKKSAKKTEDPVTKHVWKIMKYTQGHNEAKQIFKIYLPIFVKIREYDDDITASPCAAKEHIQEIKIMSCLAPEFQQHTGDSFPLPPKPIDPDLEFEIMDSFKCYVRTFSGFANDEDFKRETKKLEDALVNENLGMVVDLFMCASYDPPHKLVNRRNEVFKIAL